MPRRGANIYRRKDGRWEGRVKKDGTGCGPRKYISVYGKTYGDVKERMEHIRGQLKRRGGTKMVTLGESVSTWLKEKKPCWKQTTYTTYVHMADRHILPRLGDVPLDCVDGKLLEKFLKEIRQEYGDKGISGGYLKNVCAVILRAMNYMKKKQLHEITVPENPVSIRRQSQVIVPREQELARLMYFTTDMSYIS